MVADAVKRFGLLQPGDRVLCALSGGEDSVCLTHALACLAKKQGFTVAAAHFSHGLRPESAGAERELCERLCQSLDIPLFCGAGDTPAWAAEHGQGLEEAARALRHAFLAQTAADWQADAIATGHHLEDSAETLLLNLIRGSGGQGLQGIPPRNGRYIRPLILASKDEIQDYIRAHGLESAHDPTNFTGDNARARLRREVFPTLTGLNSGALRHLAQTALENWEKDERIRWLAEAFASVCCGDTKTAHVEITGLLALPEEAAVRALQILQRRIGGQMLERPHVEAIFALCRGGDPSAEAHLPGSRACRRYETLLLTSAPTPEMPPPQELWPGRPVAFGPWQVTLTAGDETGAGYLIPAHAVTLPLTVRSRRPGDAVSMAYGTKKVKKLLIEHKIPKDLRDTIPIVCNNKEILVIGGVCAASLTADPGRDSYRIHCRRKEI